MATGKERRGQGERGNGATGNDDEEVKLKTIKSELRLLPCVSVCDHFSLTQTTHVCLCVAVCVCVYVSAGVCSFNQTLRLF